MAWDRNSVLERCAVSAATGFGFYLLARFVNHRWYVTALNQQLQETQASLEHERVKRKADRVGRIRAEQELRSIKVELQRLQLQLELQQQGQGQQQQQDNQLPAPPPEAAEAGDSDAAEVEASRQEGGTGCASRTAAEAVEPNAAEAAAAGSNGDGTREAKRAAAAAAAALAAAGSAMPAFPFRPIGHMQSVFSERNGTPRQPQLVPAARSRLVLSPNVPAACLEGLGQYSHCWVLYVFHANTDLAKYLSPDRAGLKAKIHVPRLNGGRMGVLATRSPHRPSPIGLSTAEVISVQGNTLILGGADIVDGSPVLDIKPYVPFCDCLSAARAPAWVQAEADDEPLAVREVVVGEAAREALARAWRAREAHSMYGSAEQYMDLVRQVLSRDIRSVHQRLNVRPTTATTTTTTTAAAAAAAAAAAVATQPGAATGAKTSAAAGTSAAPAQQQQLQSDSGGVGAAAAAAAAGGRCRTGEYHVVLENIYISYDISPTGVVELYDAWVDPITAR